MKAGEKKRAICLQGGVILLTTIIFVFTCSFAQAVVSQVSAGEAYTVGLDIDGTVVAVGQSEHGQLNVGSWSKVIQVSAGSIHTVGLDINGTVVAVGENRYGQLDVGSWTDIIQVAAGAGHTVGLKSDGTVVAVGYSFEGQLDVYSWTDIIQVAAGYMYTIGLKSDGTVVAVGSNYVGERDVGSWTDIVKVAAGYYTTVGLKSDGTVVAVGQRFDGQLNVGSWTDIIQVAAGYYHTVGLKSDGTVVAVGLNDEGQLNVGSWTKIVQVSSGFSHSVGLDIDGTVVAVGLNDYGQCNTDAWDLGRTRALTMLKAGSGIGSVTSDPPGISCGSDCSERYQEGTVVTITASADTGSVFRGWSGGGCSGSGVCVVTMNASTTVTATFTLPTELSPNEGTIGTQLTVIGSDFGIKKGKVLIEGVTTKIATDGWAGDRIIALLTKVPPLGGPYDMTITLKSKPPLSIILKNAFTVMPPEIDSLDFYHGVAGITPITINGNFFSTKKGKVYLEYEKNGQPKKKNCKVTSWGMDSITFVVPKGLVSGIAYPLKVENKVGIAGAPSNFTID